MHPFEGRTSCPKCGHDNAILLLDSTGQFPLLDGAGYPQFCCQKCFHTFTPGDEKPLSPERKDDGKQQH